MLVEIGEGEVQVFLDIYFNLPTCIYIYIYSTVPFLLHPTGLLLHQSQINHDFDR